PAAYAGGRRAGARGAPSRPAAKPRRRRRPARRRPAADRRRHDIELEPRGTAVAKPMKGRTLQMSRMEMAPPRGWSTEPLDPRTRPTARRLERRFHRSLYLGTQRVRGRPIGKLMR